MKSLRFAVPLVLALLVSASVLAEEGKTEAKKFRGTVAAKGADAKAEVTAVLNMGEHKTANLIATGDVAKKVTDLVGKKVVVTGTKDGDNITVTDIVEAKERAGAAPEK